MKLEPTALTGVGIATGSAFADNRGAFSRLFCADELRAVVGSRQIVQINHSLTRNVGAVRGMHYQKAPHAEMKIVRCLRGRVFDVAVDLRRESPTFLKWFGLELAPGTHSALVIPEGCAHGFQVLEPDSELLYLHTAFYTPASEGGVRYNDPLLDIAWPLPPSDLSVRDLQHPLLTDHFQGLAA
jgi:dTDP-4-dehydrorhamnose 3,5-epimerase